MDFDYRFDPCHLRVHELNYELRIRSISTDRVDIVLKRKYLRRELKKDMSRPTVQYATPKFDFKLEKEELDTSISSVRELVDNYDGLNEEVGIRIRSRIAHILGRLNRIPDEEGDESSQYRGDNIIRVTVFLEELDEVDERIHRGDTAKPSVQGGSRNQVGSKATPVYKWNLIFDGNASRMSLSSFLHRVEELKNSRNCSDEELFQSAADLFEGIAREWFRSQLRQRRFDSWTSLVTALRRDFLPSNYDDQLRKEIEQRTQGQTEKVVVYLSVMENLFHCLGNPPTEEEKLKIIRRNLLPWYQPHLALQVIQDISALTIVCRALEDANILKDKFQPPPQNVSLLEPELAYNPSSRRAEYTNDNRCNTNTRKKYDNNDNGHSRHRTRVPNQVSTVQCWKCQKIGHMQRECRKKEPVCHGCGRLNVIRPNCPECSKNGRRGNV